MRISRLLPEGAPPIPSAVPYVLDLRKDNEIFSSFFTLMPLSYSVPDKDSAAAPMMMKDEHKILLFSAFGGLLLWAGDAAIDSLLFSQGSFLNSLIFEISPHELYFRSLFIFGMVAFGFIISRIMAKRRLIEERYENIVELSPDIIYLSDKDGTLIFMNNAGYRILERSPDEVIGQPMLSFVHPDDKEKTSGKREELTQHSEIIDFENRYITKSGKLITVLNNVRMLRNERGEFVGMQGIARDITARMLAEEELRKAVERVKNEKARSESILAAIGDGISIQNTQFKVLYQNKVQETLIGGATIDQYCYEAYAKGDSICPGCPVEKSFRDGGIYTLEKTASRDGEVRTLEIKSSPLLDSSGTIIAGIEAIRDITAHKKAQEKLKLFSEAIEEAMDGIQIVNLEGIIVYSNKAVTDIYGFTQEELLGTHVNDMNADHSVATQIIIPRIKENGRWSGELMVVHKSGKAFPVWLETSLVKDELGKPIAMIGIIRDITERKLSEGILKRHHEQLMKLVEERTGELTQANEKLRKEILDREKMEQELLKAQKLESLGIMAGGIAHDFNNFLASIMGNISLAMMDLKPEDSALLQLRVAEKVSLRAQDLTRQLLTFSKGGAPVKNTAAIGDLLKEAAGFALWGGRVKCGFTIPDDLRYVDVDEGQISQVIHNLVINADHAMPAGGTVMIRCENVNIEESPELPLRSGKYVKISVQDHGVGISQEHLSKIFDPYFTTKQKGSGLGLATSYSIIKKHGGHIVAESKLGEGTTFTIYLPASKSTTVSIRPAEQCLQTGAGKILLMDDEEDVIQTTGDVLKRLGYTVEFSSNGAQAIDLYQKAMVSGAPFDAVIMDLTVPGGMGGVEALRKLLEIDPNIKAIVSSGYSSDPIMADYRKYGFSGFVTKPYRIKDLGETLHTVLTAKA